MGDTAGISHRAMLRVGLSGVLLLCFSLAGLLLYTHWHAHKQMREYLSVKHWHLRDLALSPDGETLAVAVWLYDGTSPVATRLVALDTSDWSTRWSYERPLVIDPQGWSPCGPSLLVRVGQPCNFPGESGFFWLDGPGPALTTRVSLPGSIGVPSLIPVTSGLFLVLGMPIEAGALPLQQALYWFRADGRPELQRLTPADAQCELVALRHCPDGRNAEVYFLEYRGPQGVNLERASTLEGKARHLLSTKSGGWRGYAISHSGSLVARATFHPADEPAEKPPELQVLGGSPLAEMALFRLPWQADLLCWSRDDEGVLADGDGVGYYSLESGQFGIIALSEPPDRPTRRSMRLDAAAALSEPDHFVLLRRDRLWLIDAKQGTGRILMDAHPLDTGEPASPGPL